MIICPRCSKENQDHYKFCLGCGAELPRAAAAAQPKSFTAPTPPAGMPAVGAAPAAAAPSGSGAMGSSAPPRFGGAAAVGPAPGPAWSPAPASAPSAFGSAPTAQPPSNPAFGAPAAAPAPAPSPSATVTCPTCGNQVPRNFKFCGTCGNDMTTLQAPAPAPAPAPAAAPSVGASVGGRRGSLVLIRPDGSEGDTVPLADTVTIGRESGGPFATDSYLSPQHARFQWNGSAFVVSDLNSLNGVFLRVDREVPYPLEEGAIFRIGQEIIRFENLRPTAPGPGGEELMGSPNPGFIGRILLVIGREATGNSYCIPPEGMHLGRERGDIIFPDDGYVSGLHCRLHGEGGRVYLTDVGSSNGTFVRIRNETALRSGQLLLVGQQLFRIEY